MAQLSAAETLSTLVGDRLPSLFGTTPDDVRRELAGFGTTKQFGTLLRDFFARLTHRHLSYYLSRVLPDHVTGDGRFRDVTEHQAFDDALRRHCIEATRIVEDFAGGWYSKTAWDHRDTGITPADVGGFAHVAVEKIRHAPGRPRPVDRWADGLKCEGSRRTWNRLGAMHAALRKEGITESTKEETTRQNIQRLKRTFSDRYWEARRDAEDRANVDLDTVIQTSPDGKGYRLNASQLAVEVHEAADVVSGN